MLNSRVKKQVNFTFDQLFRLYSIAASKFANRRYDYWELISEAWLRGSAKYADTENHAFTAIYCDMIDYMRTQEGHRGGIHQKVRYKIKNPFSLDGIVNKNSSSTMLIFQGEKCKKLEQVDDKDEINYLFGKARLTNREKLIVKLRFLTNMTFREIAKVIDYVGVCACYHTAMGKLRSLRSLTS